jgi:transcriptional regulator with XRE-family HTH domain
MLQTAHIRAARALLNWRQQDLSDASKVGLATIQRIEKGSGVAKGNVDTIIRLQQALERAGVCFLDADTTAGIGVRLTK